MSDTDKLHRFMFEHFGVRGMLVHLDASWREAVAPHEYPANVRDMLGQAVAACVMLTASLKFDGRMTLQLQGDGTVPLLVVQCLSDLTFRAVADSRSGAAEAATFAELVGAGRLAITIEKKDGERYQGIVGLEHESFVQCLESYFANSEQLPTRLWLSGAQDSAVGLLLQQVPESDDDEPSESLEEDWHRVQVLADTLSSDEMRRWHGSELLRRVFAEEDVRLFKARKLQFHCPCSQERIAEVLRMLGREEVDSVLEEKDELTVACEFCNATYVFDRVDAHALFAGDAVQDAPPTVQ